eukprot:c29264_g1_i2 orf=213-4016(+)
MEFGNAVCRDCAVTPFSAYHLCSRRPAAVLFCFILRCGSVVNMQTVALGRFVKREFVCAHLRGGGSRPVVVASLAGGQMGGKVVGSLDDVEVEHGRRSCTGMEKKTEKSFSVLGGIRDSGLPPGGGLGVTDNTSSQVIEFSNVDDDEGSVIAGSWDNDPDSFSEESEDEVDENEFDVGQLFKNEGIDLEADGSQAADSDSESLCYSNVSRHGKSQAERVKDFCTHVQAHSNYTIRIDDLASLYDFPLDKFQRLAIEGFLKGSSIVVCAPTSSGKTLVAEAAAAATLASGKRLFYTTPLKALSNQKLRDFRVMFGEANVGLLTGDAALNRDAPILIMTAEILRNMLYQSIGTLKEGFWIGGAHTIVLDEVHYLSDISRGTVWEETVIYCPKEVQLICLSATIANPDELAGWISQVHGPTELITSKRRPVPLTWHFSTRFSLLSLLNEQATAVNRNLCVTSFHDNASTDQMRGKVGHEAKGKHLRRKRQRRKGDHWEELQPLSEEHRQSLRRQQVPVVKGTLMQLKSREMLPVIWFIFSRKGCDTAVCYAQDIDLLSEMEQNEVHEALKRFRKDSPEAVRESAVLPLLQGIASHHAGCLPLWKSFIEELFQRGLIKVVFATETLAAGINMPARTTVISSLSKRGDDGHSLLSANAMLQMAGRAGRRGIDELGHVVLVQTPFEGAEECAKLLLGGPDPLVSQFTASYGMVLNLLAGTRFTGDNAKLKDGNSARHVRTLEDARALIERSFGNYVGSSVKLTAKKKLVNLQEEIEKWRMKSLPTLESRISKEEYEGYLNLKEQVRQERKLLKDLQFKLERQRVNVVQPLLEESLKVHLPFVCLCYHDTHSGKEEVILGFCIGNVDWSPFTTQEVLVDCFNGPRGDENGSGAISHELFVSSENEGKPPSLEVQLFVALGSNNVWYVFTGASVKTVYKFGLPDDPLGLTNGIPAREFFVGKVPDSPTSWQQVGKSSRNLLSSVWCAKSSVDNLHWSMNILPFGNLMDEYKMPVELLEAEMAFANQRKRTSKLRKRLKSTEANKEHLKMLELEKFREVKINRMEDKKNHILSQLNRMQPSGWKEFVQVVNVLEDARAIGRDTHNLLPLGETAAGICGVNELWMAVAFSDPLFLTLTPAQLAGVCGSFVSDGLKVRSEQGTSNIYEASSIAWEALQILDVHRHWLLGLQTKYGVEIPCDLNDQFIGIVEAWASGVTWKEVMMDCHMDEGDVARLLRRSIDLLSQLSSARHLDSALRKTARIAATVMDRAPICELIA